MNDNEHGDPRIAAIPDVHGHAKGEHKPFAEERPIPLSARMLFLWFFHACKRGSPRFLMVSDHMNYLTFEDPAAVNLVRRALKLAQAGDLYGAAETAGVDVGHAAVVSEGLRRGMRYSIGAEVDNDPRARPDAQNIVDAMKPDGMIRSVHFLTIDHPTHGAGWNWPFDNPEFSSLFDHVGVEKTWELYMATLLDALERLPGNIVGHFYVPAIFGHWPDPATLEKYEDQLLEACAAREIAIEFNTRFLYRDHSDEEKDRYVAANMRLLRKAKERGVGIAVGSDAHSPKDQGNGFNHVLAILDRLEINELVFPIGGRLLRVALRVVKEPEPPAPEPVPEPEPAKPVRKARTSESPKERPVAEAPAKSEPAAKRRPPTPKPGKSEAADEPVSDAAAPTETPDAPAADAPGPVTAAIKAVAKAAVDLVTKAVHSAQDAGAEAAKPAKSAKKSATPKTSAESPEPTTEAVAPKIAPAKQRPVKAATVPAPKAAPAKAPPLKAAPAKLAPAKKTPPAKAAVKAAPVKPAAKAVSAKRAPGKAAAKSAKAAPAKAAPKKAAPKAKAPVKAKPAVKAKAAPVKAKPHGKTQKAKPKAAPPKRTAAKAAPAKKSAKPPARKPVAKKPAPKAPARPAKPAPKKSAPKKSAAKKTTSKRSR